MPRGGPEQSNQRNTVNQTPAKAPSDQRGASLVGTSGGFGWIDCNIRRPHAEDANQWNEVWWWIPRFASHGAQRDFWYMGEGATYWMHSDGYEEDGEQPDPPSLPNIRDQECPTTDSTQKDGR